MNSVVSSLLDGWDRNRSAAYTAMSLLRQPAFGLSTDEACNAKLLTRASKNLRSARLREADAAASLFRAAFNRMMLMEGCRGLEFTAGDDVDEINATNNFDTAQIDFVHGIFWN